MSLEIASSNVNRNITLAGTSVAIFTFLLFFLYPQYRSGIIDPILFQFTIAVIVTVIFSLVISVLYYYARIVEEYAKKEQLMTLLGAADAFWLLGYTLLLLMPSLILFTVMLPIVAFYGLILWFLYLALTFLQFRKLRPLAAK
jgi:O-antigen/teichoic acid export membrane protein